MHGFFLFFEWFLFFCGDGWTVTFPSHVLVVGGLVFCFGLFSRCCWDGNSYFFLHKRCWMGGMGWAGMLVFYFFGVTVSSKIMGSTCMVVGFGVFFLEDFVWFLPFGV